MLPYSSDVRTVATYLVIFSSTGLFVGCGGSDATPEVAKQTIVADAKRPEPIPKTSVSTEEIPSTKAEPKRDLAAERAAEDQVQKRLDQLANLAKAERELEQAKADLAAEQDKKMRAAAKFGRLHPGAQKRLLSISDRTKAGGHLTPIDVDFMEQIGYGDSPAVQKYYEEKRRRASEPPQPKQPPTNGKTIVAPFTPLTADEENARAKEAEEALVVSTKAKSEKSAAGKLTLAKQLLKDGKTKSAKKWLESLIKEFPDTKAAMEATELLKNLE